MTNKQAPAFRISVIITSYNQKDYLREAVESVLAQTLRPFEIIICDDASTDGSRELIKEYEKKFPGLIKGIYHEKNLMIAKNRTAGIEAAQGDLITWLDGDDRYKPRKLEVETAALRSDPEARWAYSQVDVIDADGLRKGVRYAAPPEGFILDALVSMLGSAPRNQLIYKECIKKVGLFKADMALYEDFDFCLRLARDCKAVYCAESLVEYRIHSAGLHALDKALHLEHYKKLYANFQRLIEGYPRKRRNALEEALRDRINRVAGEMVLPGPETDAFVKRAMKIFTK